MCMLSHLVTDEDEVVHAEGDGGDDDAKDGEEDPVLSHTEHGGVWTLLHSLNSFPK